MRFDDFLIPETLDEARQALEALGDKGFAFAGGTAFQYVSERAGATAVDITRLGLRGIETTDGGFRVGATTTLSDLVGYGATPSAQRLNRRPASNGRRCRLSLPPQRR